MARLSSPPLGSRCRSQLFSERVHTEVCAGQMAAALTSHLMRKATGSIIQAMTQREKPVSRWKALPDASRFWSLTERFRTWSIIIGLTLFSPLPFKRTVRIVGAGRGAL